MKENESEKIIIVSIICVLVFMVVLYYFVFTHETSVQYFDNIVSVEVPEDKGIDIKVNLSNYKNGNAILVKTDEENYDLYINITQTLATKMFKDNDTSNNMMRVGNGIIVDYQSEHFLGYIPDGKDYNTIKNIYYIKDYNKKIATNSDEDLIKIQDKQLIWTNED